MTGRVLNFSLLTSNVSLKLSFLTSHSSLLISPFPRQRVGPGPLSYVDRSDEPCSYLSPVTRHSSLLTSHFLLHQAHRIYFDVNGPQLAAARLGFRETDIEHISQGAAALAFEYQLQAVFVF